jgi:hypothetical protein
MVVRLVVLVSVAALGLVLAACAETTGAMASMAAAQAAEIAATQAEMATTQAIEQLQTASSRMSREVESGQAFQLPNLPPIHKGTVVISYPNFTMIQVKGHRYIIMRPQYDWQSTNAPVPMNLMDPEEP